MFLFGFLIGFVVGAATIILLAIIASNNIGPKF